jgi:hypothetical protein
VPRALDLFTEHLIPGRHAEVRPLRRRELAWAGVIPFDARRPGDPCQRPTCAGIPIPASVCAMTRRDQRDLVR